MHLSFLRAIDALTAFVSAGLRLGIGRTRAGVLVAADRLDAPAAKATGQRLLGLFLGTTFIGLGVALFVHADFGLPPYDVLLSVVRDRLGVTLGQAIWLMSAVLFTIASALGQRPGIWTLMYIAATGTTVDIAVGLIKDPEPLVVRLTFLLLGASGIVAGVSLVVHSALTGGAFELLMRAGAARGFDPLRVRSALEIGLLVAGVALGGDAGFGTVFFALLVGPAMRAAQIALQDHRSGRHARLNSGANDDRLVLAGSWAVPRRTGASEPPPDLL